MRRILTCLLVFLCQLVMGATFTGRVSRDRLYSNESFQLILSIDKSEADTPDFSGLEKSFTVGGVAKSNQMTVVNGEAKSQTQWTVSLMPKNTGVLTIPSFTLGGASTLPLTVTVKPASAMPDTTANHNVALGVVAKPAGNIYIQQQVIYSVKLIYAMPATIANPSLSIPTANNADVQQLPGEQHYRMTRDGRDYGVLELHYAIFPQKAGKITINPPVLTAMDVANQGTSRHAIFNRGGGTIRLSGKTLELTVLPEPLTMKNDWWLPAADLKLHETWSADLDKVHVGEAITRSIVIEGQGVLSSMLPDVVLQGDDKMRVYPDKPVVRDTVVSNEIIGERTEKYAIVPNVKGKLTLPAVRVAWWNVITDQREEATLPAKTISVLPALPGEIVAPVAQAPAAQVKPNDSEAKSVAPVVIPVAQAVTWKWFYIACITAVLWVMTLLLWLAMTIKRKVKAGRARARHEDHANAQTKQLFFAIKTACKANDAKAAKTALIEWSHVSWPDKCPQSLGVVARLLGDARFVTAAEALDGVLYKGEKAEWDGSAFWQVFKAAASAAQAASANKKKSVLPELYD